MNNIRKTPCDALLIKSWIDTTHTWKVETTHKDRKTARGYLES